MDKKKDNDQNRLKHNFAVAKIEFCAKIDYFQSKFDNICRDLKETNFCSKSFTDPLSAISICYYLARGVNMPVKQRNVRAGGRFLQLFFVIIRNLNLAPAHIKKFPDVSRHSGRWNKARSSLGAQNIGSID